MTQTQTKVNGNGVSWKVVATACCTALGGSVCLLITIGGFFVNAGMDRFDAQATEIDSVRARVSLVEGNHLSEEEGASLRESVSALQTQIAQTQPTNDFVMSLNTQINYLIVKMDRTNELIMTLHGVAVSP